MSNSVEFDILIVGGGMVGSTLACLLAENEHCQGLKIALVEAKDFSVRDFERGFDPRVVALSNSSVEILKQAGAWSHIASSRISSYKDMVVWDGEGTANISFSCHDIRTLQLGYIVENSKLLSALHTQLQSNKRIQIFESALVSEISGSESGKRCIILNTPNNNIQLKTGLLIAADGANSSIRNLLKFPVREWDYGHQAVVTTVKTEYPHQETAWQRFTAQGPIALLPLRDDSHAEVGQHFSSLVWSAEEELATKLSTMDDNDFCKNLSRAFENKLGQVLKVDKRYCLPLKQRHAETYIQDGVALVGDAAHTIHPLAGQGVNLGLYDVQILAEEIARSQQRAFSVSDFSVLQRYERRRQGHNLLAMATMEGFKRLFSSELPLVNILRNAGMRFFDKQTWLKNKLIQIASG